MSVRALSGWTPRTFTRHHYDDDGRLAESVSWTESEWTPDGVALLLASRRENIGPHGVPMDQALDPANAGKFRVLIERDHAQQSINKIRAELEEKYKHDDPSSLQFRATLVPPTPPSSE